MLKAKMAKRKRRADDEEADLASTEVPEKKVREG